MNDNTKLAIKLCDEMGIKYTPTPPGAKNKIVVSGVDVTDAPISSLFTDQHDDI